MNTESYGDMLAQVRLQLLQNKESGISPDQALSNLRNIILPKTQARRASPHAAGPSIRARLIVQTFVEIYGPDHDAVILAGDLKDLDYNVTEIIDGLLSQYRDLTAADITSIILSDRVYPLFRDAAEMLIAYVKKNTEIVYSEAELLDALTQNYPALSDAEISRIMNNVMERRPVGNITQWAGKYHTNTDFWGRYFGPLVVHQDGTVTIRDVPVNCTYNAVLNKLVINRTQIGAGQPSGEIVFKQENGKNMFNGVLYPLPGDGPCGYWSVERAADENSIFQWAGSYDTFTTFYGNHFGPFVIHESDRVTIRGVEVNYQFDAGASKLTVSRTKLDDNEQWLEITFSVKDGRRRFDGSIIPRLGPDGPCEYYSVPK